MLGSAVGECTGCDTIRANILIAHTPTKTHDGHRHGYRSVTFLLHAFCTTARLSRAAHETR